MNEELTSYYRILIRESSSTPDKILDLIDWANQRNINIDDSFCNNFIKLINANYSFDKAQNILETLHG